MKMMRVVTMRMFPQASQEILLNHKLDRLAAEIQSCLPIIMCLYIINENPIQATKTAKQMTWLIHKKCIFMRTVYVREQVMATR